MIYSRVLNEPAAGDQHSWLKLVTFSLSQGTLAVVSPPKGVQRNMPQSNLLQTPTVERIPPVIFYICICHCI